MRIEVKDLPETFKKKTFEVKHSIKNVRLTTKIQKDFAKMGKEMDDCQDIITKNDKQLKELRDIKHPSKNNQKDIERLEKDNQEIGEKLFDLKADSTEKALDYIYGILKFSDDEIDKFEEEVDDDKVFDISNSIVFQMLGIKPDDEEEKNSKK